MPMRVLTAIILLMLTTIVSAKNLSRSDYIGTWVSIWVAIKGEKETLVIEPNLSSTFIRKNGGSDYIKINSNGASLCEDLLIMQYYYDKNNMLLYKLVLSGWKVGKKKALYRTLYIYDKDGPLNGLPVSFANSE